MEQLEIFNIQNYYFAFILLVAGAVRFVLWTTFYKKRVEKLKAENPDYHGMPYSPKKAKSLLIVGVLALFGSALYAHFVQQPKVNEMRAQRKFQEMYQDQKALESAPTEKVPETSAQ